MASTPKKNNSVSSTTPLVNKSLSAAIRTDTCPKRDVVEAALQSELEDVTFIGMPVCKFMRKYFPKWESPQVSNTSGSTSWEEKDFASYVDGIFTLNNRTKPSLRFLSDGLTTPQRTEKEKDRGRPDFFLYEEKDNHMFDPSLAKDINWEQIRVIMEHTKTKCTLSKIGASVGGRKLLQLARYGRTVFSHQHNRRLLHGVLFLNPNAHLCAFTRAGIEVTEPICATNKRLHDILRNYLNASKEEMGLDSSFEEKINMDGIKEMRVKFDHDQVAAQTVRRYFQLDKILCLRKSVAGRATRIWAAQEINENWSPMEDANGLIVKDYWRETDTNYGEFELFQQAKKMGVRGIPELICGGDIKNDVVVVNGITLAEEVNALQLAANDDRTSRDSSNIEKDPHSHSMGGMRERQPRAAHYHTETRSRNDNILSRRIHCRYVFRGRGKSLEDADCGPVQLCSIVRDAMLSHYELYKIAGILHTGTLPSCL